MSGIRLTPSLELAIAAGKRLRVAVVAGEASGDLLGSGLVRELRLRFPEAEFAGVGGEHLRAAGVDCWHDSSELAVMGLAEVLRHLPRLLRLRAALHRRLLDWKPDVFIGIDAPDFNLGLERRLKQAGIRTVHYVSPSVWAWREGRAAKIGRSADLVLCLFPMEPPIYQRHGVDARFVGHPLADAFPLEPDREAAREQLELPEQAPVLALLPGSRLGEIQRLLPTFLEAARLVTAQVPGLAVAIPAATPECRTAIEALLHRSSLANAVVFNGRAHATLVAADVVLLASGTAALEAMLAKRPMVVGYRISALTYRIVMALGLMRVNRYSLPNVLANEPIVPELMQRDCTPENLASAVMHWFNLPDARAALLPRYLHIHHKLRQDASSSAADAVAELLARP
ncbi:lipid-A-disaccharide synthase [Arenimonas terrae]|uniref:Lipid-A-disaccharide synthase n=1 Tax=Arenimonas terrae TaxID=2546226 RepID=A0A5C4RTQ4_9GAMM|nr:lipid-A-disaccharide synthase [Arenimonas terrae]TNJ34251.1 lipid-A-disaccharide synthase [Arenimonas terrae]